MSYLNGIVDQNGKLMASGKPSDIYDLIRKMRPLYPNKKLTLASVPSEVKPVGWWDKKKRIK